jgi:hypothetical protein
MKKMYIIKEILSSFREMEIIMYECHSFQLEKNNYLKMNHSICVINWIIYRIMNKDRADSDKMVKVCNS